MFFLIFILAFWRFFYSYSYRFLWKFSIFCDLQNLISIAIAIEISNVIDIAPQVIFLANGTQYSRFYVVPIDFSNYLFSVTSQGFLIFELLYQISIAITIEFFVSVFSPHFHFSIAIAIEKRGILIFWDSFCGLAIEKCYRIL